MKILNVFWHSVEPDSAGNNNLFSSDPGQSVFRNQISFIVDNFTPITVFEFDELMVNKKLLKSYSKPPILLGFDDGFKNVINFALPVLREYNVPALFFVIGEILKNPDFVPWFLEMKYLISKRNADSISFNNNRFNLTLPREHKSFVSSFARDFIACRTENDRQELLNKLSMALQVKRPSGLNLDENARFISKDDLLSLDAERLITIASHAMTHRYLESLSYEEQQYELEESHRLLKKHCSSYYPVIAYPAGSFNKDTINIAKNIYKSAFAILKGSSYRNSYAYPRIGFGNDSVKNMAYAIHPLRLKIILPLKKLLK